VIYYPKLEPKNRSLTQLPKPYGGCMKRLSFLMVMIGTTIAVAIVLSCSGENDGVDLTRLARLKEEGSLHAARKQYVIPTPNDESEMENGMRSLVSIQFEKSSQWEDVKIQKVNGELFPKRSINHKLKTVTISLPKGEEVHLLFHPVGKEVEEESFYYEAVITAESSLGTARGKNFKDPTIEYLRFNNIAEELYLGDNSMEMQPSQQIINGKSCNVHQAVFEASEEGEYKISCSTLAHVFEKGSIYTAQNFFVTLEADEILGINPESSGSKERPTINIEGPM